MIIPIVSDISEEEIVPKDFQKKLFKFDEVRYDEDFIHDILEFLIQDVVLKSFLALGVIK